MKPFCPSFATLMIMYFSSWCMKRYVLFFFFSFSAPIRLRLSQIQPNI